MERDILASVLLSRASNMGSTSCICEDCSFWLELSTARVEGVAGYLAEDLPPTPLGYEDMVSAFVCA